MTVLDRTTETTRVPMDSLRKTALIAGLFYLISFVSIPTLLLYTAVHEPNFIIGPGPDTPVLIGGVLEMIVALAGLGSAVALYPIVKRQNQSMALGLVGTRTIEGAVIVVGVACLLTVVTLRQAGVGPEGLVTGHALVGLYDRLFLLSQSTLHAGVRGRARSPPWPEPVSTQGARPHASSGLPNPPAWRPVYCNRKRLSAIGRY